MAKSNKYSSVNFNDIYDNTKNKKNPTSLSPSSSSSSTHPAKSYSFSASSNGGMLVLSRPPPKPTSTISSPSPPSTPSISDSFSLRPQGKTPSPILERQIKEVSPVPKTDKFVPPHLRPGYVARDNSRPGSGHGYGEDGRPNSGGGYDRRIRPVGADLNDHNRPRSGPGSRPSSTGLTHESEIVSKYGAQSSTG